MSSPVRHPRVGGGLDISSLERAMGVKTTGFPPTRE